LGGRAAWGKRLLNGGGKGLSKATPIALFERESVARLRAEPKAEGSALSADAERTLEALDARGACFGAEFARRTGLLQTQVENALGELVAAGLVASDGFSGLRALLGKSRAHSPRRRGRAPRL